MTALDGRTSEFYCPSCGSANTSATDTPAELSGACFDCGWVVIHRTGDSVVLMTPMEPPLPELFRKPITKADILAVKRKLVKKPGNN